MQEERLPGGFINEVVRVGDTVRRKRVQGTDLVPRLLRHFEMAGWSGAPRFLGVDEQSREILSYIDGYVPVDRVIPSSIRSDVSLTAIARLVRAFHDLTAGTELAGDEEVVCHNDLLPKNTVYREASGNLMPIAFIDWDLAEPRPRVYDLAQVCWKFLDLGPAVLDLAECSRKMRLICDAYGLADRSALVDAIIWWQEATIWGIETGAAEGKPEMLRLRDAGFLPEIRAAIDWMRLHRATLEGAL